ncbi:hypothetical protein GOB94_09795 [Granulicella sp. 5B5]|uniref:DUF5715 family protein n=1 Tax=Granulicella sp. 5B5 TaxID=1617967 RepID=UPI0015F5147B|nr:DUF5715 family protein [Granulicella sp. 5B5]QMV18932.1 hypothetical protein GOB94_09795 [Granulicella sp. 5B5]
MMTRTLLGELFPRRRTCLGLGAALAVMVTLVLTLAVAPAARAEGINATRTRPLRLRRSAAMQNVAPRGGTAKSGTAHSRPKSSMRMDAKRSGTSQPKAKGTDTKAGKITPHHRARRRAKDADDADMPMLEQVRGRRGRRRTRATLRRVSARRSESFRVRENVREAVVVGPTTSLRGTREVLVHQNLMAADEGLERIQTDAQLEQMREDKDLVDFPESRSLRVNPDLPFDRRCARPWTVRFAEDLSRDFYDHFGVPLQVNSAARSVEYQLHLAHFNGNAAGVEGDTSSPHLTGQAIDFGKKGMSRAELAWMRARLLPLMQAGKIDVEEEFRQACFHISVYRTYLPPQHEVATVPATIVAVP